MNRFFFHNTILFLWVACSSACSSPPTLSEKLADWCVHFSDVHSCIVLAQIKKKQQDHENFRFYLNHACQRGHSASCSDTPKQMADQHIQKRLVQKNRCDENNSDGCYALATLYDKGIDGHKNFAEARHFYQQGCRLKHAAACNNAGDMWAKGHGGTSDLATAQKYFRRACQLDNGKGCANLALLATWAGRLERAKQLRKKACFLDESLSCAQLSWFWKWGWGTQPANKYKAALFKKRACFLGHAPSCKK